jgi:hypothetical protein
VISAVTLTTESLGSPIPGQPAGDRRHEDVAGHRCQAGVDVTTAASVVFSLLSS